MRFWHNEKFWSNFGRVSAIVSFLMMVIAAYQFLMSGPKLYVTVFSHRYKLAPKLEEDLKRAKGFQELRTYSGYIIFALKTRPSGGAENVVIDLPYEGIAQIYDGHSNISVIEFDQSINVGTVRAKTIALISIWTTENPTGSKEKEIQVTYKEGVAPIAFSRQTIGIADAIRSHYGGWISLYLILLLGGLLFFSVYKLGEKSVSKRRKVYRND